MEHRAYLMRLKRDKIQDYVEIHKKEKIWESIVQGLKRAGFNKMIIFHYGQDIILFEEAENLKKSYAVLDKDKDSAAWDTMVAEWMEEYYPTWNEIKKEIEFKEIPVVFYLEGGVMKH